MKVIRVVLLKLPPSEMFCQHFRKIFPSKNNHVYLGIESHFVGVHGPYELHRKEKQIKCTALAVHKNLLFFPMQFIWPVNTNKMRFNTYIYIF